MKQQNRSASALPGGNGSNASARRSNGLLVSGQASGGAGMGPSVTLMSYKAPDRNATPQEELAGGSSSSSAATKPKSPYLARPAHQGQGLTGPCGGLAHGGSLSQATRTIERPSSAVSRNNNR